MNTIGCALRPTVTMEPMDDRRPPRHQHEPPRVCGADCDDVCNHCFLDRCNAACPARDRRGAVAFGYDQSPADCDRLYSGHGDGHLCHRPAVGCFRAQEYHLPRVCDLYLGGCGGVAEPIAGGDADRAGRAGCGGCGPSGCGACGDPRSVFRPANGQDHVFRDDDLCRRARLCPCNGGCDHRPVRLAGRILVVHRFLGNLCGLGHAPPARNPAQAQASTFADRPAVERRERDFQQPDGMSVDHGADAGDGVLVLDADAGATHLRPSL